MLVCSAAIWLARDSTPALLDAEPPVMLPPGFKTCPSSVTIFVRLPVARAMATASSSVLAMMVLPSRCSASSRYFASVRTSSDATPT